MESKAESVSRKMEFRRNLFLQNIFRNGPIGSPEQSRNLKVSKSRLCEVILKMIDEGLIVEDIRGSERRGRNPVPLSANPDYGSFVGIDFEAQRKRIPWPPSWIPRPSYSLELYWNKTAPFGQSSMKPTTGLSYPTSLIPYHWRIRKSVPMLLP